jgi:hypothetical protein
MSPLDGKLYEGILRTQCKQTKPDMEESALEVLYIADNSINGNYFGKLNLF